MTTNADAPAAFQFSTAGAKTMADDTLRLTIDISPKDAPEAFRIFGQRGIIGAIALLSAASTSTSAAEESSSAAGQSTPHWSSRLYKLGWWMSLDVLKVLGPEEEYADWVRAQDCAGYYCLHEPPSEYAHVRRAGEAGTGYKPPYRAIPLCHACHQRQHQHGESALSIDFDKALREHLSTWAHERLREHLGVESLTEVALPQFAAWLEQHELMHTFPGLRDLLESQGYSFDNKPMLAGGHPGARA